MTVAGFIGRVILIAVFLEIGYGVYSIANSVKHMDKIITEQFRME